MSPQFTIYSAERHAGKYVARSIESVLTQTFTDYQYVLIDDASEDDTWSYIDRAIPSNDPRIWQFRRNSRQWKLANFVWSFPCMQGDVIVELDGDDWFAGPDSLQIIADAYAAHPAAEATCGSFRGYPKGYVVSPATLPCKSYRFMQNGFASSTPAPRTWKRHLTTRSLTEMPQVYIDPKTQQNWHTNADLALFSPATLWADEIVTIDDVLVEVNYETQNHDFNDGTVQREEGMRLYEFLVAEEWRINAPLLRQFTDPPPPHA